MLALLFTLLLLGPCAPSEEEMLFCEGIGCAALGLGDGGAGGDAGAGHGGDGGADAGAGGAGGSNGPPPCECDDGNSCNGLETCAADGSCITTGEPEPVDDENRCTADQCVDGEPHHEPMPQRNMDDHDPCTIDYCDATIGLRHDPIPGCQS